MIIKMLADCYGAKAGDEIDVDILECDHRDDYQPHKFRMPDGSEVWLPATAYIERERA